MGRSDMSGRSGRRDLSVAGSSLPAVKLTITHRSLVDTVAWAARSLSPRPSSPVLAGLRLDVRGDRLTVSGGDGDGAAEVSVGVDARGEGAVLVHGHLLADLVRALPPGAVELTVDGSELDLVAGAAHVTLPTMPLEEHPGVPPTGPRCGQVDAGAFAAAISRVVGSASREDAVPVLTAVRLGAHGDVISLLATDRYRLAACEVPWTPEHPSRDFEALVPARMLAAVATAFGTGGGQVALATGSERGGSRTGVLGFVGPDRRMTTRLFDDVQYPPVHRLLDGAYREVARLGVATLVDVVRRAALVAEHASPICVTFGPGRLLVTAGGPVTARTREELDADCTAAEPFTVAFSPAYLLDGLLALSGELAVFSFTAPTRPPLITAADAQGNATGGFRYLVQPVRTAR